MNVLMMTCAAPPKSPFSTKEKRPPLGLGSLISIARDKGHQVHFIDNYLKPMRGYELEAYIKTNNIDLVGIYLNTICFQDGKRLIETILDLRDRESMDLPIAVGGPHTSVLPETIPEGVDYIVQGEGEMAWRDILDGTCETGLVTRPRMKDLDWLPFQPWDLFGNQPYDWTCGWMDEVYPVFTMNTSRGCPFKCSFCSVDSIWGSGYTLMTAERILEEVTHLVEKHGARGIYFREDNFTLNRIRTRDFCRLMKDAFQGRIKWACETRVDNLTEPIVKAMAEAGCRAFYLGVESGSAKVLKRVNKRIDMDQVRNVITWGKKYGINCYASLITGVPGETFQDFKATEALMMDLKPYHWSYNVFVGIPYSSLYHWAIENGYFEYIDENGLGYPSGFDIKVQFFYGRDSHEMVDHDFKWRTPYDAALKRARMWWAIHKRYREVLGALRGLRRRFGWQENLTGGGR